LSFKIAAGVSSSKSPRKEKSASPRKPVETRASSADSSDDPTVRASDFNSASSTSTSVSVDKEATTDEDVMETFITVKNKKTSSKPLSNSEPEQPMTKSPSKQKPRNTPVTADSDVEVEPAARSPSKRKPTHVPIAAESDNELEPAAESVSKGSMLPMIAVAENVQGKKCYFRLVQMTLEEVNAIDGTCIPYKLV
jgi:hypothetical protein